MYYNVYTIVHRVVPASPTMDKSEGATFCIRSGAKLADNKRVIQQNEVKYVQVYTVCVCVLLYKTCSVKSIKRTRGPEVFQKNV